MIKKTLKIGKQQGFNLVELMISLVVASILLTGAITVLVNNRVTYVTTEDTARLYENIRIAMDLINRDVRMAGYIGCINGPGSVDNQINIATPGNLFDISGAGSEVIRAIEGYEQLGASWLPSGNSDVIADIVPGTDAITLRGLRRGNPITLLGGMIGPGGTGDIPIAPADAQSISQNAILGIGNCATTHIFQASAVNLAGSISHAIGGSPGNSSNDFGIAYGNIDPANPSIPPVAWVFHTQYVRYYIGTGSYGGPSLFRQAHDPGDSNADTRGIVTQELVEGIENMQISYGIDDDDNRYPETYVLANAVTNWAKVSSVRIGLLARTINNAAISANNNTYQVNDQTIIAPGDLEIRKVLTSTVYIRNKFNSDSL